MTRDATLVELGPRPLDEGRRWMARVLAYEVDGELLPVSIEVRMKSAPCAHDEPPQDQPTEIEWERQDCDCWPEAPWPRLDAVPSGGLPIRLLRNLRLNAFLDSYRDGARLLQAVDYVHPVPTIAAHLQAVTDPGETRRRGRPRSHPSVHLRRLAALDAAYAAGETQQKAARRVGVSVQALQSTLAWARQQEPPLWGALGRGRAGRLTQHGRAAVATLESNGGES